MKFKDLEAGQRFMYEGVVLEKVPLSKGSCCTKKHNCIYLAPSDSIRAMLIDEDSEIEVFDGKMPVNDIILKGSEHFKAATLAHQNKKRKANPNANEKDSPQSKRKPTIVQKYNTPKPKVQKKPQFSGGGSYGPEVKT